MTATFTADHVLGGLKQFQRATVDHVFRRFYEDEITTRRFLVADETGLGKSMVARGLIARTIERLQDVDAVGRIDIVYVCSNADIAEQNLKRLDVLGSGAQHRSTRLTLLARDSGNLRGEPHPEVGKRVNLVSFTPGTSFDLGDSTGRADERALLHVMLCDHVGLTNKTERRGAALVLQGWAGLSSFEGSIDTARRHLDYAEADRAITTPFFKAVRKSGLLRRFEQDVTDLGRRRSLTDAERPKYIPLIGALRSALAKAGVHALEPDLVILDEFQRFRHLLAVDDPRYREAAELADDLFNHGDTRVLLLSATPYKPFTYAEEAAEGDDHEVDLRRTLSFLAASNGDTQTVDSIVNQLALYRHAAVDGQDTSGLRGDLETSLTKLMCRTERPRLGDDGMLDEQASDADPVTTDDLVSYAALRSIATELGAPMAIDYWKSTPYFLNFCDGYKFGEALRHKVADLPGRQSLRPMLEAAQHLDSDAVHALQPIESGNARLRRLAADTVGRGMWRLLWLPPSLPYVEPGGPFADPLLAGVTKRLIFSSWAAAPTAIASLLSHEATRNLADGNRAVLDAVTTRLDWRMEGDRPGAMTTLALFWPSPTLAHRNAPFGHDTSARPNARTPGAEPWYWTTILEDSGAAPDGLDSAMAATALSGDVSDSDQTADDPTRLRLHVDLALSLATGAIGADHERRTARPDDLDAVVTELGTFGPGNIAYRCVERLISPSDDIDETTRWRAAAVLSSGLRSLFNRPEAVLLLDQLLPGEVYWRAVLRYCAWGNLEAALDEYLNHLAEADRTNGLNESKLLAIADSARAAITPRPSRYEAFDPLHPDRRIPFPSRFALRYGSKRAGNEENARQPEVRSAFNSPFWPFVLATTSIGQEGIDLHWWCHAAVHWNTPASPVDFEQREGRVHRYGGHAIRKNLAERHGPEILEAAAKGANPWDEAYRLGIASASDRFGELAPHWITDGTSKIQRHIFPYPLSNDHDRYRRLKDDLVLYRLAFGQPRQEDMIEMLRRNGVHLDPTMIEQLRLDLRPPASPSHDVPVSADGNVNR